MKNRYIKTHISARGTPVIIKIILCKFDSGLDIGIDRD